MGSLPAARLVSAVLAVLPVFALVACGAPPLPKGRVDPPAGARIDHEVDPSELFPADLDLVVRIDVGRMRAGIGPAIADRLAKTALTDTAEDELREAMACAEVVWIACRAVDALEPIDANTGDRVVVIEGKSCMPDLAAAKWERVRSGNARLRIFDRVGEAPRWGTARIMNLGNHAAVFVSPVELDAVKRVMNAGPDERRGTPSAEGLVSFDQRAGRLPPGLEKKYPAIAGVLAGIERVRGFAVLVDDGLRVEAEVVGASKPGADRAARFLDAMRDNLAKSPRFGAALKDVRVEQTEKLVQVRLTVPAKALLAMVAGDGGAPAEAPRRP
jgi:hypothetical protein